MWKITYLPQAVEILKKLDGDSKEKILDYLEKVALNPESFGKPLYQAILKVSGDIELAITE